MVADRRGAARLRDAESDAEDAEEDVSDEIHSFMNDGEDSAEVDAARRAENMGMAAATVLELLICMMLTAIFQVGIVAAFIWVSLGCFFFFRIFCTLLRNWHYKWGKRLLLPSFLVPCCMYAAVTDILLIHTCQAEVVLVNLTSWNADSIGVYPKTYIECHNHRNGSMIDILNHEIERASLQNATKYVGGFQTSVMVTALACLDTLFRYGIPVVFGYIFIKGVMAKALDIPGDNKQVFNNVRLFCLDIWDICGFATMSFNTSAHIWFEVHRSWAWIKVALLIIAGIAGFAELLLGLLLKAEHNSVRPSPSPRDVRRSKAGRVQDERGNALESLEDNSKSITSYLSLFFIDVPFSAFRCYLMYCHVYVNSLYLMKNAICGLYEVARAFHCDELKNLVENLLSALPGVEQVELTQLRHKAERRKERLQMAEEEFEVGDEIRVASEFNADTENGRLLKKGMRGRVVRVDREGDIYVKFDELKSRQWVMEHNFHNLDRP